MDVTQRLLALLADTEHRHLTHAPITSAAHAAQVRGTPLDIGGKSVLMKLDRGIGFAIVVLSGARRLSNPALRAHLGLKRYRFATPDELRALTGLTPGSVPPFGRPLFELPLYVDAFTAAQRDIAFTIGVPDQSVVMATTDWLDLCKPTAVLPLSQEA